MLQKKQIKIIKDFGITILVSIIILIIYALYLFTVGSRLTESREVYIDAYNAYQQGDYKESHDLAERSNELWSNKDAQELMKEIKKK